MYIRNGQYCAVFSSAFLHQQVSLTNAKTIEKSTKKNGFASVFGRWMIVFTCLLRLTLCLASTFLFLSLSVLHFPCWEGRAGFYTSQSPRCRVFYSLRDGWKEAVNRNGLYLAGDWFLFVSFQQIYLVRMSRRLEEQQPVRQRIWLRAITLSLQVCSSPLESLDPAFFLTKRHVSRHFLRLVQEAHLSASSVLLMALMGGAEVRRGDAFSGILRVGKWRDACLGWLPLVVLLVWFA